MAKDRKTKKRRLLRNVFNPRGWSGYDNVKQSGQQVADMFKDITTTRGPTRKESFAQAMKRLQLSDEDIAKKMMWLYRSSWIYFIFATLVVIYAFIALFTVNVVTFAVSGVIAVLGYTLAFRDSFFYFQMKRRKLGLTFKEWVAFILRQDQSSSKELDK